MGLGINHILDWWSRVFGDSDAYVALFTGLLFASTSALWFSTNRLWRVTDRTLKHAEITAGRQLRAYVSLSAGGIARGLVDGAPGYAVTVQLKNAGLTPGYKFTTWIKPPEVLSPDSLPFTEPTPIEERTGSSVIAANGGDAWVSWNAQFRAGELEAIRDKSKALFIWGGADYRDIFGRDQYFVFRLCISGPENAHSDNGWALKPHPSGYDAS
jgi:hypothetical protein